MAELTPLYNRLKEHNRSDRSSFHTPGHKCSGFFDNSLLSLDYTELPDTDALYEAEGVILETEINAARLFGAQRSLISAGGCSLAIQAMLKIASQRGGKLLCARNAHRSAVNAAALLGMDTVWLMPQGENGYTGRIMPEDVSSALKKHKDITACYITSPSYYGEISDIAAISDICHSFGVILLVDNAHGSHLAFMKKNMHPIFLGADMSACSLHKTMPVLTGGALLNIADKTLAENAKAAMSLFGSTSPSYLIMSSIDLCIGYMYGKGRAEYLECEKKVSELKTLAEKKGIRQPEGVCDPLRLTLNTASAGLCGPAQQQYFENCGIDCEFCDGENAVLLFTPFNSERDYERVRSAIVDMPVSSAVKTERERHIIPEKALTLRQAVLSASEIVDVTKAEGRIAADTACPCPPGVPVVMPGEKIDSAAVKLLESYRLEKIAVCK